MDLDLRKLRYFAAVAEHQHFGRAAEQLYIAQPVLSRQVRALERELGCSLLERTTRSVRLTPAGRSLQEEARRLLASADAAVRRVHEVDRGVERLAVAFAPGLRVSEAVRAFGAVRPEVGIELIHLAWREQDAPLRDGRADVGYLRRPFDDAGLRVVPVGWDPKVVVLPRAHRLARRRSLHLADLAGEPVIDPATQRVASVEEKFELVAAGHGIAVVPASAAGAYPRPDLVRRPLADATPLETCLAVMADRQDGRNVAEFLAVAAETLGADQGHSRSAGT